MLVASGSRGGTVLAEMLEHPDSLKKNFDKPEQFIGQLARLAATSIDKAERSKAIAALVGNPQYGRAGLAGFLDETRRKEITLDQVRRSLDQKTRGQLDKAFASARADATDANRKELVR